MSITVRLVAALILVAAVCVLGWWLWPLMPGAESAVRDVEDLIRSWGAWGVAGSIGLMVAHSFLPFPSEIVALANGMLYGPLWGTVITWVGAMLGASAAFAVGRMLGRQSCCVCFRRTRRTAWRDGRESRADRRFCLPD